MFFYLPCFTVINEWFWVGNYEKRVSVEIAWDVYECCDLGLEDFSHN